MLRVPIPPALTELVTVACDVAWPILTYGSTATTLFVGWSGQVLRTLAPWWHDAFDRLLGAKFPPQR